MPYTYSPVADDSGQNKYWYICEACDAGLGYQKKKFCTEHLSAKGRAAIPIENEAINSRLKELEKSRKWIYAN